MSFYYDVSGNDANIFIEKSAYASTNAKCVYKKYRNTFNKKDNDNVQIIISTHSSHILGNAKFESIKYFSF
ncbi:hypothetical protein AS160_00265 [Marinitoga sp. 38H-ov]|nr:hypothetical protein AS160_00265 [Marinitoga sp. 38H-ov]